MMSHMIPEDAMDIHKVAHNKRWHLLPRWNGKTREYVLGKETMRVTTDKIRNAKRGPAGGRVVWENEHDALMMTKSSWDAASAWASDL